MRYKVKKTTAHDWLNKREIVSEFILVRDRYGNSVAYVCDETQQEARARARIIADALSVA